jgi:hypothetical protein
MIHLPIRPTPEQGEWFQGYLGRLIAVHGAPVVDANFAIASEAAAVHIQSCKYVVDTRVLPRWALSPKSTFKHCPLCLKEGRPIIGLWRIEAFHVCVRHETCATNLCRSCGRRTTLVQLLNTECACGSSLAESPAAAEPARVALATALNASSPSTVEGLTQQSTAFRLLSAVARSMRGRDVRMTNLTVFEHAADWLRYTGLEFNATQSGLEGFLKALRSPLHRAAAAEVLDSLRQDEELQALGLDQQIGALQEALLQRGEVMTRSRALGTALFAKQLDGGLSLFAGAKKLGVWPESLRAALIELDIPTQSFKRAKTTFLVFSEKHLPRIEQHLETKHLDRLPSGVSTHLQVDRRQMRSLKRSGLITVYQGQSHDRNAATELVEQLAASARPIELANERVIDFLHSALWVGKQCMALKILIKRIQVGGVAVYSDARKTGLAQFSVPLVVLNEVSRLNKGLHWKRLHRASAQSSLIELPMPEEMLSC